jgi:hypothetical protein
MKIILYLFLIVSSTSCVAKKFVYTPSSANLIQLDSSKDFKVAINYATAGSLSFGNDKENKSNNGIDLQTAYAINNKIAVKLDGFSKWETNATSFINSNSITKTDRLTYQKKELSLSIGYYKLVNSSSSFFQLFLGLASGSNKLQELFTDTASSSNFHNMNYTKIFFQPSFSLKINQNFTSTLAAKFSLVNYNNIQTDYKDLSKEILGYIDTKPSFFGDIILQNEFGFTSIKPVRFQIQLGLTNLFTRFYDAKITDNDFGTNYKYYYNDIWFNIGAIVDMRKVF